MTNIELRKILSVSRDDCNEGKLKSISRIKEAMSYEKGPNQENRISHVLWKFEDYEVTVSKPGKEAAPDYNRCKYTNGTIGNNPTDMYPSLSFKGEEIIGEMKTFEDIYESIFSLKKYDSALELLACLIFRSAFTIDHFQDSDGRWKYEPPLEIVNLITNEVSEIKGIPILAFLHYLDAIGLNEDVKYNTLGYVTTSGYGRRNNMLTCVNLIAVLLERHSISKFAGSFARPPVGISAISFTKALDLFPYLRPIKDK